MIHEIGVELQAQLQSKLCPFPVVDGPEFRPTTTFGRERVVIEHDHSLGDHFTIPAGASHRVDKNPRTLYSRVQGCKITIYAQQPSKGANYFEHVRRANQVVDMVCCALYSVVKKRANFLAISSGKFVFPPDLEASETKGGAVYELLFTIDRGVADRNWDGTVAPTVAVTEGFIKSTTQAGDEIACGNGGT